MLPSDEILKAIASATIGGAKAGWIFPDGSVVLCDFFEHRKVLPAIYQERYQEYLELHERYMDEELATLEPNEHPAMHRFDPSGGAENDLMNGLAKDGYVRFGVFKNTQDIIFDVRTSTEALKLHHYTIAYICSAIAASRVYFEDQRNHKRKRLREFET